jgi:hypothetical protein
MCFKLFPPTWKNSISSFLTFDKGSRKVGDKKYGDARFSNLKSPFLFFRTHFNT